MENVRLIEPVEALEQEYNVMLNEWLQTGESLVPFVLEFDSSDFKNYVNRLIGFSKGIGIPSTFVNHSTYWLVNDENKILGVSNVRHTLNERLLKEGGHIGYGIRPSERRKGYATEILKLSLEKAAEFGIKKVLVTCDKDNTGSSRSIIKNGGRLWREHMFEGRMKSCFWIENQTEKNKRI